MWLILCETNDLAALWVYEGLRDRGFTPLEMVRADTLIYGITWEHRLGSDNVTIDIKLSDGRRINNREIWGVINRLLYVPNENLTFIHPSERNYIMHELTTFFISWLYALPKPVLNRPTPQGLSGYSRHISEWVWLAAQAGLPTPDYVYSDNDCLDVDSGYLSSAYNVFVVGNQFVGELTPPNLQRGCLRLAELSKTALLGIKFAIGPYDTWTFAGATPFPDLRLGGQALLDTLAMVLVNKLELNE
jgi:hypothetical protein